MGFRQVSTKLKRNKKAGESERVKHRSKVCWTSKETGEGHYRPGLPILHQMGKIVATAILEILAEYDGNCHKEKEMQLE